MEPNTRFLNVDLDVKSSRDLNPLLKALGREVCELHSGRIRGRHWIRIELSRRQPETPGNAIRRFCRLLDRLPSIPRKLWKDASMREFNIGIQAGAKPTAAEWILDAATLKEVAKLGAQIGLTIYSPVTQKRVSLARLPSPDLPPQSTAEKSGA